MIRFKWVNQSLVGSDPNDPYHNCWRGSKVKVGVGGSVIVAAATMNKNRLLWKSW